MVSFLFHNASSFPDRLALADADADATQTLTFRQFQSTVAKVASGLARLGAKKRDIVLLFAPNSIHFPLSFFGMVSLGDVATTVNPLYTVPELSKQARDSGAKLVITVPALWNKVKELALPAIIIGSDNSNQ